LRLQELDTDDTKLRVLGVFGALLLGVALPTALLADVMFGGWSIRDVSTSTLVFAIACGVFGAWLLLVSLLALKEDLEKVLEFFQADSAIVFFLPRMLAIGTRSVWRRLKPPTG
jgi:hypothetical protein